jgi:hypothetical protein
MGAFVSSRRFLVSGVFVLAALCAAALPARAQTTYHVSNVAQLGDALAVINAGPGGDRIVMAPGFYGAPFGFSSAVDVTIEGDPSGATVIDCGGIGSGAIFATTDAGLNVTLRNLTLQNATFGIDYEGSGTLTIENVLITGTARALYNGDVGGVTSEDPECDSHLSLHRRDRRHAARSEHPARSRQRIPLRVRRAPGQPRRAVNGDGDADGRRRQRPSRRQSREQLARRDQ